MILPLQYHLDLDFHWPVSKGKSYNEYEQKKGTITMNRKTSEILQF